MTNRYYVREGSSEWEIVGELLAVSSSKSQNKPRWVEFQLFRTQTGSYVLSRVGKSLLVHKKECKIVGRNNLKPTRADTLDQEAIACPDCSPQISQDSEIYPETPRYFAQKTTTAKGVLAAVMQYDDNNSEYLTNVAKRLLIDAAEVDDGIDEVFSKRVIE